VNQVGTFEEGVKVKICQKFSKAPGKTNNNYGNLEIFTQKQFLKKIDFVF